MRLVRRSAFLHRGVLLLCMLAGCGAAQASRDLGRIPAASEQPAEQLPPQQATTTTAAIPAPAKFSTDRHERGWQSDGSNIAAGGRISCVAGAKHGNSKQLQAVQLSHTQQGSAPTISQLRRLQTSQQRLQRRLRSADGPATATAAGQSPRPAASPALQEAASTTDWIGDMTMSTAVISKPPPQQMIQAEGPQGATVDFDGSKSTAELGAEIQSYSWTITGPGDFTTTREGEKTSVTLLPGSYTAQLIIKTSKGQSTDTVKFSVEAAVTPPPPSPAPVPPATSGSTTPGSTVTGTTPIPTTPIKPRPSPESSSSSTSTPSQPGSTSGGSTATGSSSSTASGRTTPSPGPESSRTTGEGAATSPAPAGGPLVTPTVPSATAPGTVVPPVVTPVQTPPPADGTGGQMRPTTPPVTVATPSPPTPNPLPTPTPTPVPVLPPAPTPTPAPPPVLPPPTPATPPPAPVVPPPTPAAPPPAPITPPPAPVTPPTPPPTPAAPVPPPSGPAPTPSGKPDLPCTTTEDYDLTDASSWDDFNDCCNEAKADKWDMAKYFPACVNPPPRPSTPAQPSPAQTPTPPPAAPVTPPAAPTPTPQPPPATPAPAPPASPPDDSADPLTCAKADYGDVGTVYTDWCDFKQCCDQAKTDNPKVIPPDCQSIPGAPPKTADDDPCPS